MDVLTTHGGQQLDLLFHLVGTPDKVTAVLATQFPSITIEETGQSLPNRGTDQAMAIGTLQRGGLFSVHVEGGNPYAPGIQIDVAGTAGALKLTSPLGNSGDFALEGANGEQTQLAPLPTPDSYQLHPAPPFDASVQDLAVLYAAYAQDTQAASEGTPSGTSEVTTFADAVAVHRVLDAMTQSSQTFLS